MSKGGLSSALHLCDQLCAALCLRLACQVVSSNRRHARRAHALSFCARTYLPNVIMIARRQGVAIMHNAVICTRAVTSHSS